MAKKKQKESLSNKKSNKNITNIRFTTFKNNTIPRIKAFIVDMFMIMMPILYLTTYVLMDGKADFQQSELARWATALIYGIIIITFWKVAGQSPGLKAYELKVVDAKSLQNITLLQSVLRYIIFILTAVTIVGLLLPFFRDDKKTIYDILTGSLVISIEKE